MFFVLVLFLFFGFEVVLLVFVLMLELFDFFVVSEVVDLFVGDWVWVVYDGCDLLVVVGGMFVWEVEFCG